MATKIQKKNILVCAIRVFFPCFFCNTRSYRVKSEKDNGSFVTHSQHDYFTLLGACSVQGNYKTTCYSPAHIFTATKAKSTFYMHKHIYTATEPLHSICINTYILQPSLCILYA